MSVLLSTPRVTPATAAELDVRISNPPATGTVYALLFKTPGTFLDLRNPDKTILIPPGSTMTGRFQNLPPGQYALVAYQDKNANGRLDKNFIGIPNEPLGFSNNYWPQGPPTFSRAAIRIDGDETNACNVELKSILGKAGRIGAGVGVISQTSPYRDSSRMIVLPIPAISYIGDRVQIMGTGVRCGLLKWHDVGLAATANYRLGAYQESDSPALEGLGDREGTMMGGLAFRAKLPVGILMSCGYENDLLGKVNGGLGRFGLDKGFQRGIFTVSPSVSLNWITAELADYDYGVPADKARAGRPSYQPGDAISLNTGLSLFVELSGAWRIILSGRVEFLPPEITDSPIVDKSQVLSAFGAVTRLF